MSASIMVKKNTNVSTKRINCSFIYLKCIAYHRYALHVGIIFRGRTMRATRCVSGVHAPVRESIVTPDTHITHTAALERAQEPTLLVIAHLLRIFKALLVLLHLLFAFYQ